MQELIKDHPIYKIWGGGYLEYLEYDLPQDEGYEFDPITFQQNLANMTAKTVKYAGDQLFHALSRDNNHTTVNVIYFPHQKVEATHVLNRLPRILSEQILFNPNNFITISGIEQATMGIWDKDKRTFAKPNYLDNQDAMEGMFEGTGLTELYLDQDQQAVVRNKMGKFDKADIQKTYAWAQGKDYEKVIIASILCQIRRKLQEQTNTYSPPGFNISPQKYLSITSGLTEEAAENEYASLLGRASLALDSEGDDIPILSDKASLTGGDVYPPGDASLRSITETGHTRTSKVKQATSLLTQ